MFKSLPTHHLLSPPRANTHTHTYSWLPQFLIIQHGNTHLKIILVLMDLFKKGEESKSLRLELKVLKGKSDLIY